MNLARVVLACALAGWACVVACGDVVSQPIGAGAAGDAGGGDVLVHSEGAVDVVDAAGDASAFCSGQGPITLPGMNMCLGDLANVFRFAACACDALDVSGTLYTDSFDGPPDGGASSFELASIAANGEVSTNSKTNVGGSVWSGGADAPSRAGVTLRGNGTILHDVRSGGPVEVGGTYLVQGDVWSNGNVTLDTGASLAVVGTVHVPAGDSATGVQGSVVNGPVQVTPPCDCSSPIDVGAVVALFASDNDDSVAHLSPSSTLDGTVSLPCGRYYVASIAGAIVTLEVKGRVALFVSGGVNVTQSLTVKLAPSAELDLFVAGDFSVMGSLAIGDANAAARTRLYVGGTTLSLSATASPLTADVYAPNATIQLAADLEMWGALFAKSMQFSGAFTLHYDTSVLQLPASGGCEPPGKSCNSCNDCPAAAPACKSGTCSPCATTADCCAPLECESGQCVLATTQ
ncbi:MAG TPA: hypothetical protein VF765_24200 [Polyangiaceae bacterium]